MRKLLIVVGMAGAFIASEACAAKWVAVLPGGPKTTSLKYMTGSAYVEKGTGLVRIMLCTLEPCSDNDDGPAMMDLVNDTDAVIDCSQDDYLSDPTGTIPRRSTERRQGEPLSQVRIRNGHQTDMREKGIAAETLRR